MTEKWNSGTTIKFIQKYKLYECLWNPKCTQYKNTQMKTTSYQQIAKAMDIPGFSVSDVKHKMKNLRSTYYQENKKIDKSKASGSSSDDIRIWQHKAVVHRDRY